MVYQKDSTCHYCAKNNIDDTLHARVFCDRTSNRINEILNATDPNRIWSNSLNHRKWLFGVTNQVINNILLIMKYFLCQVRAKQRYFSFSGLKQEIFLRILADQKFKN